MNEPHSSSSRSWTSGFGQEQFPGIEDTFSGPPDVINPTVLPAVQVAAPTPTPAPTSSILSKLPFNINISNMSDVKALVDRMGGVEGILTTMGKFQKFMATMQQIAPMVKLFMGKKDKTANAAKAKRRSTRRRTVKRTSNAGKRRPRKTAKRR